MFCRKILTNLIQKNNYKNSYTFYRNLVNNTNEKIYPDIFLSTMENCQINSVKDWSNVRKAILEHEGNKGKYNIHNIDAMIVGHCAQTKHFDLGASYLSFLAQENIKPNLATIGKYLKLVYLKNHESCLESGKTCSKNEEELIVKYYEDLRHNYPVLDSLSLENIIPALSLTSRWKECLDLLQEIKISAVPSSVTYSAVVASAFLHEEYDLGWKFLEEMLVNQRVPKSIAYLAFIRSIQTVTEKEDIVKKLEKLFMFFQENDLKCPEDVAICISELGKTLGFQSKFTTVAYKGLCKSCSHTLDRFELSDEDFIELRNKIFENVIVGRDVFVKTNPAELEVFKKFTSKMKRYDVILDGLNIAYSVGTNHSPHVLSSFVACIVSHFVRQRKKVLVLGRVHMNRWPQKNWGYITQYADVFLTQDISQDDPYLLYCALNSGKDTVIVTRDLMRSHKFLLRETRLKMLFNRWLSQRQWQLLRVDNHKGPIFSIPPPFNTVAQCNGGIWHIPYDTDAPKDKNEFHRTWLCLRT